MTPQQRSKIEKRVLRTFREQYGVKSVTLDMGRMDAALRADSLDDIEMVLSIEEEFDVEISDDDWHSCETVGDVAGLVVGQLNGEKK